MKKTNMVIKFKNSLYNIKKFPSYIKEGFGRAILYAVILCLIFGLGKSIRYVISANNNINRAEEILNDKDYEFTIEDDILDLKTDIQKIEEGNIVFYIDDQVSLQDKDDIRSEVIHSNSYFLILKDGVVISSDVTGVSGIKDMNIYYKNILFGQKMDNKQVLNEIPIVRASTSITIVIMTIINTVVSYFIDSLFIVLMMLFSSHIMGLKLKFQELFTVVIYAQTLPALLVTILTIISPKTYFYTAGMVATLLYTFLILRDISKDSIKSE